MCPRALQLGRMALDLFQDLAVVLRVVGFQQLLHHEVPKLVIRQLHLQAPIGHGRILVSDSGGAFAGKRLVYE